MMRKICVVVALVGAAVNIVEGQSARAVTVRAVTAGGQPVPYAVMSVEETPDRIADVNGALSLPLKARDSVKVSVRRIGFRPFDGWARRAGSDDVFEAVMTPVAAIIDTVRVTARQATPLANTGFYERVERVKKSAMLGEFISPEELDRRNYNRLSDILQGRQYSRVQMMRGREAGRPYLVVQGRGRCLMNIVVDGQHVRGTSQDLNASEIPTSIRSSGSAQGGSASIGLDDIVDGRSIMGVEIYPSMAGAPVELIPTSSRGSCGLVVIWTGPRK
ncbi:MAG: hypothetical protein H3C62_12425 [Gemmatimonadaceae bacterium]|nr:hypothetical protein [Gemmatimonadaceae bacterium]